MRPFQARARLTPTDPPRPRQAAQQLHGIMGNVNQTLRTRYKTDVEEAIEDLPIERKVEMYHDLQRQAALLKELEEGLVRSLTALADEEAVLREREEFLERRRQAYMKRLDPSIQGEEEDDSSDEEEGGDDEQGEKPQAEPGSDENAPARANVGEEPEGLGSIEVKDGPSEQKKEELRAFLEKELPEIQRNVALRARTLWFKQKEYDDKLEDARNKLKEVQKLIEAIEPGIPSLATTDGAVAPTV